MRWAFAALLLLLSGPLAQAIEVLDDPVGDVRVDGAGEEPTGRWSHADMVSLGIDEGIDEVAFHLGLAGSNEARTIGEDVRYLIDFRFGTYAYQILIFNGVLVDGVTSYVDATLYRQTEPDGYNGRVANLATAGDGVHQITVTVPRGLLRDHIGLEPSSGLELTDVRVRSSSEWADWSIGGPTSAIADRMPDFGDARFTFQTGVRQEGEIRLSTDERIRGSNGQATTFFWRVQVNNLNASFDDAVTLSLIGVPEPWIARLPLVDAQVPANGSIDVPLLLTIPFAHQHGVTEAFVLEARSVRDAASVGRIQLGVEFLDPAQPAGHHDRLHLHSYNGMGSGIYIGGSALMHLSNNQRVAMNSLSEDPLDTHEPVLGFTDTGSDSRLTRTGWVVSLEPRLRLGLDFDMDRTGALDLPMESPIPLTNAVVHGKIMVIPRSGHSNYPADYDRLAGATVVADVGPTEPRSLGSAATFSPVITPRPEGDLVPQDSDASLVMVLWLHADGGLPIGSEASPAILPGGSMVLPLTEYHDPIDETFSAPDFLQVGVGGATERSLAPGTALLWELMIRNGGERTLDLEATVQGAMADWVEFPGGTYHSVANNTTAVIPVAVRAPEGASHGDQADLVIEVADLEDPRIRGIVRIVATVARDGGPGDVIPEADQSAEVDAIEKEHRAKKAPAPGLLLLLVAAVAARRRL